MGSIYEWNELRVSLAILVAIRNRHIGIEQRCHVSIAPHRDCHSFVLAVPSCQVSLQEPTQWDHPSQPGERGFHAIVRAIVTR